MSPSKLSTGENGSSREGFRCTSCGEWHDGLPLDFYYEAPLYWDEIPEKERPEKGFLDSDKCVIEDKHFFVRGLIEIPVLDLEDSFRWGVWVSLSQKNFERALELWDDPALVKEPGFFGWLSNRISGYPDTLNLKTNVRWRNVNWRPFIELEPSDHPLAIEQRNGITRERVVQIAEQELHSNK